MNELRKKKNQIIKNLLINEIFKIFFAEIFFKGL